ncbi:LOB domain-containing protein 4 [Brachypodium distachyon]|nr:LOB domain-containing protein 4 [Brachypodium distachyon]|eukprot:XP_010238823.1 LOB domain-containing protein 4 [Brachypodium distachyon]
MAGAQGGSGSSTPCASCKLLRRRCARDCVFAPYFPPEDPARFATVHRVFGASNVSKMLQELPAAQRADAVSSLVYEATARARDPVYGCAGAISYLQHQVAQLQVQLAVAQAQILHRVHPLSPSPSPAPVAAALPLHDLQQLQQQQQQSMQMDYDYDDVKAAYGGGGLVTQNDLMNSLLLQEACCGLKKESLWT